MSSPFNENDLFVSLDGNDRWSGRLPRPSEDAGDGPLATIAGARNRVRELKATGALNGPVTVWIRGGRYAVSRPIVFGPEDSGPVTYAAYPGEEPVIDGGTRITDWSREKIADADVWVADVSKILAEKGPFRQLFADGVRRPRSRLPKKGYFWIENLPGLDLSDALFEGSDTFQCAPGDIRNWKNLNDVEVVAMHYWTEERMPIRSFDEETNTVKLARRSIFKLIDDIGSRYAKYYVENVFEALGEPGEWYLDRPTGKLYYVPMPGEDPEKTDVVVTNCYQLLKLMGKPQEGGYVEFLRFVGLAFEHADWVQPDGWGTRFDPYAPVEKRARHDACIWPDPCDGKGETAAVPQAAFNVPGAIHLEGARNCAIEDCRIERIGFYGIDLCDGCTGNRIVGNTIRDLGAGGVKLSGAGPRGAAGCRTGNNRITDNHICEGGRVFLSGIGVVIQHAFGNLVAHNHIHDFFYSGISCGWTWGYGESAARENRIEKNHVHDLGKGVISDMGGVYLLGVQPGTTVRGNVFHDIRASNYGGWGIYPDEGSSHIVIENNISYNTSCHVFHQHFGRENTVRNNIWAFGGEGMIALSRGNEHERGFSHPGKNTSCAFTFVRNVVLTDRQPVFVGGLADETGNLENGDFESDLNLFWDVSGEEIVSGNGVHGKAGKENLTRAFDFDEWRALGFDLHSIVADPKFADPENFDFRLAADSPAFALGFKPIDTSDVGPRPKEKRTD